MSSGENLISTTNFFKPQLESLFQIQGTPQVANTSIHIGWRLLFYIYIYIVSKLVVEPFQLSMLSLLSQPSQHPTADSTVERLGQTM